MKNLILKTEVQAQAGTATISFGDHKIKGIATITKMVVVKHKFKARDLTPKKMSRN